MENIPDIVKQIITEELKNHDINVKDIFLFGSRARETYKEDSDWDFFVVIDKELNFPKKWDMIDKIKIKLAKLRIPNDIILKSQKEIQDIKEDVGRISYYALKESIPI